MNEADLLQHAARCGGWREHFPMKSADVSLLDLSAKYRSTVEAGQREGSCIALLRGG